MVVANAPIGSSRMIERGAMACKQTAVLSAEELDIPAIRQRYQFERDRRMRSEGQDQYVRADTLFEDFYETDPHMPLIQREPISEELEVAILGAGWDGIQAAYHLKKAGVSGVRTIDLAGDFGGCWYWNRYLIRQTQDKGALAIEPSEAAQDQWVSHIRETAIDLTDAVRSCTPGYYNNEGEETVRWYLGETYGPGWFAFLDLMDEWRSGDRLPGMMLTFEATGEEAAAIAKASYDDG